MKRLELRNVFGRKANIVLGSGNSSGNESKTILDTDDLKPSAQLEGGYIMPKSNMINFGNNSSLSIELQDYASNKDDEYCGRFTVNSDDFTMMFYPTVVVPDNTPDFENGHTYEFNIKAGIVIFYDITHTPNPLDPDDITPTT